MKHLSTEDALNKLVELEEAIYKYESWKGARSHEQTISHNIKILEQHARITNKLLARIANALEKRQ